jgi:SAM-dependent methyltransferase
MNDLERLAVVERQFRRRPQAYRGSVSDGELKFILFLVSTAGSGRDDRVLDVACGNGAMTLAFAERCGQAVGLDVMAPALAQGRTEAASRGLANAQFTLAEPERMPFADGAFTGAACRFSFHHFVNPARVFAEMTRRRCTTSSSAWPIRRTRAPSRSRSSSTFSRRTVFAP